MKQLNVPLLLFLLLSDIFELVMEAQLLNFIFESVVEESSYALKRAFIDTP